MNVDTVNRNLLWQAFPDGYLAMRGVATVGGWTCWRTAEHDGKTVVATFVRNKVFGEVNCFGGFVTWDNKPADLPDTPVSSGDLLPDLTDPATVGALLALVREAWKDPHLHVGRRIAGWGVWTSESTPLPQCVGKGDTEAEALIAALEAVGKRIARGGHRAEAP